MREQMLLQVQNARQAGAIAAIIYDDTFGPLIIMSKPLGHPDPAIPAVFVAQKTGIVMQKFLKTGTVTVQIVQVRFGCNLWHTDLANPDFCKQLS